MTDLAHKLINEEEGRAQYVYPDHLGFWTIGVGCLVDQRKGGGLCDKAIDAQLEHDIARFRQQAENLPGYAALNDVRRAVIISMLFQLGSLAGWPKFRKALADGDYDEAAEEGMNSAWAKQTPKRARRQMHMLRTGEWT
jgi:lysozyme